MFSSFKQIFASIYQAVTSKLAGLFSKSSLSAEDLEELRALLLKADVGSVVTESIITQLQARAKQEAALSGKMVHDLLARHLSDLLAQKTFAALNPIIMLVGINGSGKTTTIAKLAQWLSSQNKRVLVAAADTYRAAATEQLQRWTERMNIPLITGAHNADPSSVIFQALAEYQAGDYDYLIIDTAGRLQTKEHLMKELEKMRRVITKKTPEIKVSTLLTLDAMLGQNSLDQARLFNEATQLDGIILTKMDGAAKGGIVFAVVSQLHIPIAFVCFGEQPEAIMRFDASQFISTFLDK